MEIIRNLLKDALSDRSNPVNRVIAVLLLIQVYVAVMSFWRGLDGTCQVSNFTWDVISDYGCRGGLGVRGFLESAPQPPSIERNQP